MMVAADDESRREFRRQVESLTPPQWLKIELAVGELIRRSGSHHYTDPREVINKVAMDVLSGERAWPRDVAIGTFLYMAARSNLANLFQWLRDPADGADAARKVKTRLEPAQVPLDEMHQQHCDPSFPLPPDCLPVPELKELRAQRLRQEWMCDELLKRLKDHFQIGTHARSLLHGIEAGLKKRDILQRFELSETQYEAAKKRLDRAVDALAELLRNSEPETS
jgi:hypothetical protein